MFSQSDKRNKRHTSVGDVMLAVYSMYRMNSSAMAVLWNASHCNHCTTHH